MAVLAQAVEAEKHHTNSTGKYENARFFFLLNYKGERGRNHKSNKKNMNSGKTLTFKDFRPEFMKGMMVGGKIRFCIKCPTKLLPNVKWYCSGFCMAQAKADGTYGHEVEK